MEGPGAAPGAETLHVIEVDGDLAWMDAPTYARPSALQKQILEEAVEAVSRGQTVVFMRDGVEVQRMGPQG